MSLSDKSPPLSQALIMELLDYDPHTGLFRWRTHNRGRHSRAKPGAIAGCVCKRAGYRYIRFGGRKGPLVPAARLAWIWMTGEEPPPHAVDHINGRKSDDRWINLRLATPTQQAQNRGLRPDNKSGFKGVSKRLNRWHAIIQANGKRVDLGYFDTPEEAARVYDAAARQHFGEFARLNFPLSTGDHTTVQ